MRIYQNPADIAMSLSDQSRSTPHYYYCRLELEYHAIVVSHNPKKPNVESLHMTEAICSALCVGYF